MQHKQQQLENEIDKKDRLIKTLKDQVKVLEAESKVEVGLFDQQKSSVVDQVDMQNKNRELADEIEV